MVICVVTNDGLFSAELKQKTSSQSLALKLREADKRFALLNGQFRKREIQDAVNCGDVGLLLRSPNYLTIH